MKRFFSKLLALCIMFSLCACSSSKNKEEIVTVFDALNMTLKAKSGSFTGQIEYNTKTKQKINYSIDIIQDGDMKLKANMGLEAEGNKMDDYLNFYIKDGKTYLNNLGTTSQSVASNIGIDTSKTIAIFNPFLDLNADELSALFKSSSKNGNTYTLVINPEKLATLLDGMGTLNISKATVNAVIDNDRLSNLDVNITGNQAFNDISYDVEIHFVCEIKNFNSLSQIDFPKDLDSY